MKQEIILIGLSSFFVGFATLLLGPYVLNYFQISMPLTGIKLASGFFIIIGVALLIFSMIDSGNSGGR